MIGQTPVALLITLFVAMIFLGWARGKPGKLMQDLQDGALGPICSVALVTGAGGMFGGVLRSTGIGDAVATALEGAGLPMIVSAI